MFSLKKIKLTLDKINLVKNTKIRFIIAASLYEQHLKKYVSKI